MSKSTAPERDSHAIYFDDPSLTQQNFRDECDINLILERARNGADISHLNARVARYGDVSSIPDYRSALDTVNRANALFMELDAGVRERFANDPAKFVDFCQNPANLDEMVKLGLAKPKPAVEPVPPLLPVSGPIAGGSGASEPTPKAVSK